MQPAEGIVVADRFRLERRLGEGGMGAVWRAHDRRLDVPCALKFLHAKAAGSADIRARFEREAKAAAQLRSPNVVQILDHGVWEGMPFMAMELLEGEDLEARLRRVGRLEPRETAAVVEQVARAAGKAHAAGIVHRDLKPANIFLVRDEDREIVKVLDFGIAKQTRPDAVDAHTRTGSIMGSPAYMSPEQSRGHREVDHRTDLWALGVIAFRCLVGRLPFEGDTLADLHMKILAEPLPMPSQVAGAAGVPPGFDAWWARAVAREPAERFQSARELSDTLAAVLTPGAATGSASASEPIAAGAAPVPAVTVEGPPPSSVTAGDPTAPPGSAVPTMLLFGERVGHPQSAPLPPAAARPSSTTFGHSSLTVDPPDAADRGPRRGRLRWVVGIVACVAVTSAALLAWRGLHPVSLGDTPGPPSPGPAASGVGTIAAALPAPALPTAPVPSSPLVSPSAAPSVTVVPTSSATSRPDAPPAQPASRPPARRAPASKAPSAPKPTME